MFCYRVQEISCGQTMAHDRAGQPAEAEGESLNLERETGLELAIPTLARPPEARQISDLGDEIPPIDTQ